MSAARCGDDAGWLAYRIVMVTLEELEIASDR
jgi:hypothetical protein